METLFTGQYRDARVMNTAVLPTPQFGEMQLGPGEANTVSWQDFSRRLEPIVTIPSDSATDTSFILTPKRIIWSHDDINLFAGHPDRRIDEYDDFTKAEGNQLFSIYQRVVDGVLQHHPTVHIATGFNPMDITAGHHSVKRFHSHIYVPSTEMLEPAELSSLGKFFRLAFLEPFSSVTHDVIEHHLHSSVPSVLRPDLLDEGLGYSKIGFDRDRLKDAYGDAVGLYRHLKDMYGQLSSIYTDGESDPLTQKYVPVGKDERARRYKDFMANTDIRFRPESKRVLEYLVDELRPAGHRDAGPREIQKPNQIHLTRGFAGSYTFRFLADDQIGYLDFAPRVVTTSAVAKTLYGEGHPAEIIKGAGTASFDQQERMRRYEGRIKQIFQT